MDETVAPSWCQHPRVMTAKSLSRLVVVAIRSGRGGARVHSITVTCTNSSMLSATAASAPTAP